VVRTVPVSRTALALDVVAVLVFVGIGRSVHTHGVSIGGVASTAWPFAVGLAVGWLALFVLRRPAGSIVSGALVCVLTVGVGMTLRVLAGQGTAVAFIVVALCFLGATMCGWRVVARFVRP
jgi:Protein of unknown function (DUF3054)